MRVKASFNYLYGFYTKIDTTLDRRGEVEGGGAHHAHDDRVVEEDHDERCLEADPRLGSVLLSPNCSGASLDSSGQAGAGAEMADNVITCFDGERVGLDEAKNRPTFYNNKYNKTFHHI